MLAIQLHFAQPMSYGRPTLQPEARGSSSGVRGAAQQAPEVTPDSNLPQLLKEALKEALIPSIPSLHYPISRSS